jgi:hypothetical protein
MRPVEVSLISQRGVVYDRPRVGMAVGPVGMDTRGFRTHRIWIRVQKLTRGSYRVGTRNISDRVWVKYFTHGYLVDTRNINIPL